jgi:hypothetical protein
MGKRGKNRSRSGKVKARQNKIDQLRSSFFNRIFRSGINGFEQTEQELRKWNELREKEGLGITPKDLKGLFRSKAAESMFKELAKESIKEIVDIWNRLQPYLWNTQSIRFHTEYLSYPEFANRIGQTELSKVLNDIIGTQPNDSDGTSIPLAEDKTSSSASTSNEKSQTELTQRFSGLYQSSNDKTVLTPTTPIN